jgi:hypothetical protein
VTGPDIAPQAPRLCQYDGFELVLDVETARRAVEAGWPVVELYVCRNGHSVRVWGPDALALRRAERRGRKPCAVCGLWLPMAKKGDRRHVHDGACQRFKEKAYRAWTKANPGKLFFIEEQPWYRGIHAPLPEPLPPLDPLAGGMPWTWSEGWARIYGDAAAQVPA